MRALLIHNPFSGLVRRIKPEKLIGAVRAAGFQPDYYLTSTLKDLNHALERACDLVIVAGGDGTIREVGMRLIGRNLPLSVLPMGTANNICNALGIKGNPTDIIARLQYPIKQAIDVGLVETPWGQEFFFESAGFGFFAANLANYQPEKGRNLLRSIHSLVRTTRMLQLQNYQIWLDGRDLSGKYLMVEAFNIHSLGPRVKLAPEANPRDGLLDVVVICEDARTHLIQSLMCILNGSSTRIPSLKIRRGQKLEFIWTGFPLHVDGQVCPKPGPYRAKGWASFNPTSEIRPLLTERFTIGTIPSALELWIPGA